MLTRLEPSEVESTELHAFERGHLVTDGIEHPPHLAILALRQFDQQMRFARRRLAHRGTPRQDRYVSFDDPAADRHRVQTRHRVCGIGDPVGQPRVSSEQEQARRRQVEPADGNQPLPRLAERRRTRSAALRVAPRRHHPSRFVKENRAPRSRSPAPRPLEAAARSGTTRAAGFAPHDRPFTHTRPVQNRLTAWDRDNRPSFDKARPRGTPDRRFRRGGRRSVASSSHADSSIRPRAPGPTPGRLLPVVHR